MEYWGQLITLSLIALALSMDAFSLGIGLGFRNFPKRKIALLSSLVGLFHVIMPLVGIELGQFLSQFLQEIATFVGGGMLCCLGANMLWNSFQVDEIHVQSQNYTWFGLFLFSLSVSFDSLSAGLGLGFFAADRWLAVSLCGLAGLTMAFLGIGLGKFAGRWLGSYGEALGGVTLMVLGIKLIW